MVTIQIKVSGTGLENTMVRTSGGVNQLAARPSITVPAGYQVYFEATATGNTKFIKWVSADGVEATQNPITLPVTIDGSITAVFQDTDISGPVITGGKEYVFEFSGPVLQNEIVISAIDKIVGLLGGKKAYLEGNKLVVVM